ncbi:methyltransferase family protein [Salinispora arenicola]|uniref:methyltransferase family protein n=1 Tax=Salinispora arenicola TaxID=168697 RepID=UPI0027DD5B32|nr:hypothetical protein [Salinispora arenicola]
MPLHRREFHEYSHSRCRGPSGRTAGGPGRLHHPVLDPGACALGIADHLTNGPCHVDELARRTGSHPRSLLRLLRALAARGIFTETSPQTFDLTPLADPLPSDHPDSLREAYP